MTRVFIGTLLTGGVFIRLTSLSPKRDCWRVRGIGVAVSVKTSTEFLIFNSLFLCITPKRCSSSTINSPRLFLLIFSDNNLCVPTNISTRLSSIASNISFCLFFFTKRDIISMFIPNFFNLLSKNI